MQLENELPTEVVKAIQNAQAQSLNGVQTHQADITSAQDVEVEIP